MQAKYNVTKRNVISPRQFSVDITQFMCSKQYLLLEKLFSIHVPLTIFKIWLFNKYFTISEITQSM